MESVNVSNAVNAFENYKQELKKFQEKYPKAFKTKSAISSVLPKSSFSLLSSKERKELSTIYFHLAKSLIENDIMSKKEQPQALDYLNASIGLDAMRNKEAYNMIAKIHVTNNNQLGAYANFLIAVILNEISRKDKEFFIQQCRKMPFPAPKLIKKYNTSEDIWKDSFFNKEIVMILEPGTYIFKMNFYEDKTIVIIGIGEVIIRSYDINAFVGHNSNLVLYNVQVECTQGHTLDMESSKVIIDNCCFIKCSDEYPPICIHDRKSTLFMNESVIANSKYAGGILIENDSKACITNCEIHHCGMSAIEVRYGSSLYAERNDIHHNKQGILVWLDANEVKILDNVIHNNNFEGVLINGNREPALSKNINKPSRQHIAQPPPLSSYTKPLQTVVVLKKNVILKNGNYGISVDYQAKMQMEENEVANNGIAGCIIKGGADASIYNNVIHHNEESGIEIGMNYNGKVIVENNHLYANKKNVTQLSKDTCSIIAKRHKVSVRQLNAPAKITNNKMGENRPDKKNFVNFHVSSNRPGMHLFYEKEPCLYAIGNTYGFNLLKDLDISTTLSTTNIISFETQKVENKHISVFLGGAGDLRNIVETVHGFTMLLESNHNENCNINLIFAINDFNPTMLARDLVLLEMITRLPDPKSSSKNFNGLYNRWNKNFVIGVIQILSVWAEKIININTSCKLKNCIDNLIEYLTNTTNNAGFKNKLPSWISFKYSPNTLSSMLQALRDWKEKSPTDAVSNYKAENIAFNLESINELLPHELTILENLKKRYSTDEDIKNYTHYRLPVSIQAQSCDNKYKLIYSESNRIKFNATMLTVPTMEDDVYPALSIFRAFRIDTDPQQFKDQSLALYDNLLLNLLPKFASLRASLCETSEVQVKVMPILGDVVDTLLCQLPSTVKFDAVDCSNLGDYISILNILLAAAPRLIDDSKLTLQIMKLHCSPKEPMKDFVEKRLGLKLDVLASLTGIIFVDAYYEDFAVYVTWKFDVADNEENVDKLMTDVISVANACCTPHILRIKGLSINILVRLFQIMITRFPKEIMTRLLQLLFSTEGFTKHVQNFAMHLVELKTFMTLHLSSSIILELEEFEDLKVPIARYTVSWKTDKINKIEKFTIEWFENVENNKLDKLHSEAGIWLQLINPAFNNGTSMRKNKGKNSSKNVSNNQEPICHYLDSISLNADEAPTITISFYLPTPFYDAHKDWILECHIGTVAVLTAAKKVTLSKATQNEDELNHYTWVRNEDDDDINICKLCRKPSSKTCSKCKLVYYCSKICQKEDWKRHKKEDCVM